MLLAVLPESEDDPAVAVPAKLAGRVDHVETGFGVQFGGVVSPAMCWMAAMVIGRSSPAS